MSVERCLRNVRCDTGNCRNFASYNINTSGYKGNLCLCEECFNALLTSMQKAKKIANSNKSKGE